MGLKQVIRRQADEAWLVAFTGGVGAMRQVFVRHACTCRWSFSLRLWLADWPLQLYDLQWS